LIHKDLSVFFCLHEWSKTACTGQIVPLDYLAIFKQSSTGILVLIDCLSEYR